MRHAWMLAAVLTLPGVSSGQAASVLHITVTLLDAAQDPVPVPRHALLISDNPATREPRRVLTAADGTVDITLRPGSYTVESDRTVTFLGKAYQWTQMVDVTAGHTTTLALTADNAEVVPLTASPAEAAGGTPGLDLDPLLQIGKWQASVVAIWSPTTRGSGFVVDARGLIATSARSTGRAASVEVQLSPTVKVPARVIVPDASREVAILWVDPGQLAAHPPIPLPCPPAVAPSLDEAQEVVAIVASTAGPGEPVRGDVTTLSGRAVETDLRFGFGDEGGPAFNEAGAVVGLTSVPATDAGRQSRDVTVVRIGLVCEAVAAARLTLSGSTPPAPTRLPTEPSRPYGTEAVRAAAASRSTASNPPVVSSADFDVAFITPPMVAGAQQRSEWTGGRSGRSPEAEARIGRLTDFGAWTDYFADVPAVLVVRVTPKMVEGFWKRLAREAARTQGAELPAFKDFKTSFLRMRASCGGAEVTPIHPFVLEHSVSEKDMIREGLYVFDPDALGPQCGGVTLSLFSEKAPERADTLTIDPKVIDQIRRDFVAYRASGR